MQRNDLSFAEEQARAARLAREKADRALLERMPELARAMANPYSAVSAQEVLNTRAELVAGFMARLGINAKHMEKAGSALVTKADVEQTASDYAEMQMDRAAEQIRITNLRREFEAQFADGIQTLANKFYGLMSGLASASKEVRDRADAAIAASLPNKTALTDADKAEFKAAVEARKKV